MGHCIRPAQQRQAATAQHVQAAETQGFFNLSTRPELLNVVEDQLPEHREPPGLGLIKVFGFWEAANTDFSAVQPPVFCFDIPW